MSMIEEIQSQKAAKRVMAIIVLLVLLVTAVSSTVTAYAATVDYYQLKAGDTVIGNFSTQEEAQQVIEGVIKLTSADGKTELISIEPELTINLCSYKPKTEEDPVIAYDTEDTIQWILRDHELVSITVARDEVKEVEVNFETKEEETDDLYVGEEEVKQEGVKGVEKVTERVTFVNGVETERVETGREQITAPVEKIILKGTAERPVVRYTPPSTPTTSTPTVASDGSAGAAVASYALQFVGYPYVYGGTSLTTGCDCSGFVYAAYRDMGYSIPRNGIQYYYPSVPASEARPGDIIYYGHHYAMYIGGGMEVEAMNENMGICTAPVGYHGYYTVYRIIP